MKRVSHALVVLVAIAAPAGAQNIVINTQPAGAKVYQLDGSGNRGALLPAAGANAFQVKLEGEKGVAHMYRVQLDGYAPIDTAFVKGGKYPKQLPITLTDRLIGITALPYDAQIFLDGRNVGTKSVDVIVPAGKSGTVELRKPGFKTVTRTYHNRPGADVPPMSDNLELKDRSVLLTVAPSGAAITVDGAAAGETTADVTVPNDKCVTVKVARSGYSPIEKVYCNKEAAAEKVPLNETLTLRDRLVSVNVTPREGAVFVNGRRLGQGDAKVVIPEGQCMEVGVVLNGFVQQMRNYCNQVNMSLPQEEHFQLAASEAWASSIESDQANVNFTIEVGTARTNDDAWKVISQIVMSHFDILEITDKETGYIRTAWQVKKFEGEGLVRTRIIVKLGDTAPLKYVVKIASEFSLTANTVKDDEEFKEWSRILNTYKDVIDEIQARLK